MKLLQTLCSSFSLTPSTSSKFTPFVILHNLYSSSSSTISTLDAKSEPISNTLTQEQLTQINHLIPRLCSSNHLHEAIRLTSTALLTNPPLNSLPISTLITHLSSEPNLTQTMSFLNRLKHNPNSHPSLLPITKMLISSYFKLDNPKSAIKVFNWVLRPDCPCTRDWEVYGIVIDGVCKKDLIFEGLKVVREMVGGGFVPGEEIRGRVYRGLLREARIKEAREVNEGLESIEGEGGNVEEVVRLLDHVISNWVE